jgi:hypothetical protein
MLGHILLHVSSNVIPSEDTKKRGRYPSETALDSDSSDFSSDIRWQLSTAIQRQFGIELHVDDASGQFDRVRNDAFLLARQRLIREKSASYAEQFQGMYALTRGLVAVFAIAIAFYAGGSDACCSAAIR